MFRPNTLKARMAAGDSVFGAWVGSGAPVAAEVMAHLGFDFLVIDQEHGLGELSDAVSCLRAAESSNTPCVVRAPWNDPIWLKRGLDAGIDSWMIPSVETAEEAAAAVRACRYPPAGTRGYAAPIVRASTYGVVGDYTPRANDNQLMILQIESARAVENTEAICAVPGVDVVFIGCNDLAGSIGRLEQLDHPDVRKLITRCEDIVLKSGKPLGTVPNAGASTKELFARGYRMVVGAHDLSLMRDAGRAVMAEVNGYKPGKKG
jgi:4-hydroxy-2-oxoheptanedioate aldolase